mmetsp:Transcript_13407/g.25676  ORF Transcript_13407/g.25676 Transcript_13407/m.25676 type:complete len:126 (-) Transcript_13407:131-508(-)
MGRLTIFKGHLIAEIETYFSLFPRGPVKGVYENMVCPSAALEPRRFFQSFGRVVKKLHPTQTMRTKLLGAIFGEVGLSKGVKVGGNEEEFRFGWIKRSHWMFQGILMKPVVISVLGTDIPGGVGG